MKKPKYSIIVPTCDRHVLLERTIKGLLLAQHDNYEILVSDNYSSPETREAIMRINHPRVRYVRTERRMALCDHWDFALSHATGEYFIINGDDDGLTPGLLKRLDQIIDDGFSFVSWATALYFHPDWEHDEGGNVLQIGRQSSGNVLSISVEEVMDRYARLNRDYFPESTRICCKLSVAQSVIRKTGRLFWPLSVDLTSSLLLLGELEEEEFAFIDAYMGYGGRSRVSNAAAYERCPKKGEGGETKRADDFYKEHGDRDLWPWHPLKTKAYWNGHAAAWTLFRRWYDRWPKCELDWPEVLARMLAELYGLTNTNPFVGRRDLRHICEYLWTLPLAEIKAVQARCLKQASNTHVNVEDVAQCLTVFAEAAPERVDQAEVMLAHRQFGQELLQRLKTLVEQEKIQIDQPFAKGLKTIGSAVFLQCDVISVKNGYDLMDAFENLLTALKPVKQKTPLVTKC